METRHGIQDFAWGNSSWSFLAVRAPHARVAQALQRRSDVLSYEPDAPTGKLTTNLSILPRSDRRAAFLIQLVDSNWTVIVRTVHWLRSVDSWAVASIALELSGRIKCPALSGAQDDQGVPEFRLFENGQEAVRANPAGTKAQEYYRLRAQFEAYFKHNGLYVPAAFIDTAGTLYLCDEDRASLQTADRIIFNIERGDRIEERHVVYRLENVELRLSSGSLPAFND